MTYANRQVRQFVTWVLRLFVFVTDGLSVSYFIPDLKKCGTAYVNDVFVLNYRLCATV